MKRIFAVILVAPILRSSVDGPALRVKAVS